VRQIYEKSHEYNIELHNLFIDYTQAFDKVYRTAVIKSLKQFRIPKKLQNLITLTLQNTTAQVRANNDLTEAVDINTGVRQGDPLSALLFSTVIDIVMKNLDIIRLKREVIESGLVVNMATTKTKYMKCSRNPSIETHINMEDRQFEKKQSI
jgi:hypothetical protein